MSASNFEPRLPIAPFAAKHRATHETREKNLMSSLVHVFKLSCSACLAWFERFEGRREKKMHARKKSDHELRKASKVQTFGWNECKRMEEKRQKMRAQCCFPLPPKKVRLGLGKRYSLSMCTSIFWPFKVRAKMWTRE